MADRDQEQWWLADPILERDQVEESSARDPAGDWWSADPVVGRDPSRDDVSPEARLAVDQGGVGSGLPGVREGARPGSLTGGEDLGRFQSGVSSFVQGAYRGIAAIPKGAGILQGKLTDEDPRETGLYRTGEAIEEFVERVAPVNPEYQEEFLASKVPQGLGSTAAFLGGGLAAGGVKAGAAVAALMGSATGASDQFEDALDNGATIEQAMESSGWGGLIGTSEAVPITRILDRFDKASGGMVRKILKDALVGGTEEAIQEAFQTITSNLVASDVVGYDPDRGMFTGSGEGAAVGFTVGSLLNFITGLVGGRRGAPVSTPSPAGERETAPVEPLTPEDHASPIPDDIIREGREIVADAQAAGRADQILQTEGLPPIGQPAVTPSGAPGVVEDAWRADDTGGAGATVRRQDGATEALTAAQAAPQVAPGQVIEATFPDGETVVGQVERVEDGTVSFYDDDGVSYEIRPGEAAITPRAPAAVPAQEVTGDDQATQQAPSGAEPVGRRGGELPDQGVGPAPAEEGAGPQETGPADLAGPAAGPTVSGRWPRIIDSTSAELDDRIEVERREDFEKLVKAFGSAERAKRFDRLERQRHTSRRAEAEFDLEFGDLTPEQEELVYQGVDVDRLVEIRKEVREAESFSDPEAYPDPVNIGAEVQYAMRRAKPAEIKAALNGDDEVSSDAIKAAILIRGGLTAMRARGMSSQQIDATIIAGAVARGMDEATARELLGDYLTASGPKQPRADAPPAATPTRPAAITPPPKALPALDRTEQRDVGPYPTPKPVPMSKQVDSLAKGGFIRRELVLLTDPKGGVDYEQFTNVLIGPDGEVVANLGPGDGRRDKLVERAGLTRRDPTGGRMTTDEWAAATEPAGELEHVEFEGLNLLRPPGIEETDRHGNPAGLQYVESDEARTVVGAFLPPAVKGKGMGSRIYRQAAAEAFAAGKRFESDTSITPDGQRLWDALARSGYEIELAADAEINDDGTIVSPSDRPIYVTKTQGRPDPDTKAPRVDRASADRIRQEKLRATRARRDAAVVPEKAEPRADAVQPAPPGPAAEKQPGRTRRLPLDRAHTGPAAPERQTPTVPTIVSRETPAPGAVPPAAPETTTEQTPEGQQTILPGAEQISDRELAERRMAARDVRGGQQGLEGLSLFDESARPQDDLFGTTTTAAPRRTGESTLDPAQTRAAFSRVLVMSQHSDFDQIVAAAQGRGARRSGPTRLTDFLIKKGGLRDDPGGELRARDLTNRTRPALISERGRALDDAALIAWEEGYFPGETERPSTDDLLVALEEDINDVAPRYREVDQTTADQAEEARGVAEQMAEDLAELGLADATPAQIRAALTSGARAASRPGKRGKSQLDRLRLTGTEGAQEFTEFLVEVVNLIKTINPDPSVSIRFVDELFVAGEGAAAHGKSGRMEAGGAYFPAMHLIALALSAAKTRGGLRSAAVHEAWHSIERLLTKAERQVLLDAYPSITGKAHIERVAEAFEAWYAKQKTPGADLGVRRIFAKIRLFLQRLGNMLRRRGFQTVDDIFARAFSGEVGARFPTDPAGQTDTDIHTGESRPLRRQADRVAKQGLAELGARASEPEGLPRGLQVRGADRQFVDDMGRFKRWVVHPRTLASISRHFTRVYMAAIDQWHSRDRKIAQLQHRAESYFSLPGAVRGRIDVALSRNPIGSRGRVDAVLERGRLYGTVYGKDGAAVIARDPKKLARLSRGKTITLNDREAEAYRAVRDTMDHALDMFRDQTLTDLGFPPGESSAAILARVTPEMAAGEVERHKMAARLVREVEQARRTGYVPFTRWGNVVVVARRTGKDGGAAGDGKAEVIWSETIEADTLVDRAQRKLRGKEIGQNPKVRRAVAELERRFAHDPDVTVDMFQVGEKGAGADPLSMSSLDALADMAKIDGKDWDQIRERLEQALAAKGFRRHFIGAKNTPGYSVDLERAIADYIQGLGGYLAKREYSPAWDAAIEAIPETRPNERRYAERYRDYVNTPAEEWQALRQFGFVYYIAGNISTAVLNMTQVPLFTAPYMKMFASSAKVMAELARAYVDAKKMLAPFKAGTEIFDPARAPADVREAFTAAWDEGFFVPIVTYELMGRAYNRSAVLRGLSGATRKAVDVFALTYSYAERLNRIVTFIATYRLAAQDPTVLDRAAGAMGRNELARAQLLPDLNPASLARWVVDETHFVLGKVNRPESMRGIGSAILQFKSFPLNALEFYARLAVLHGRPGKKAVALMMALLFVAAGWEGLPFADDAVDLIEGLYKTWNEIDLDIRTEVRQMIAEMTGSARVAEVISKGSLRLTGVDMSKRIGMGNILPSTAEEAGGVPLSLTVGKIGNIVSYMAHDQGIEAFFELWPSAIRNPGHAQAWRESGIRSRSTGIPAIAKEEITTADIVLKSLGVTPAWVAERRERHFSQSRSDRAVNTLRSSFYTRLARAIAARSRAEEINDVERSAELAEEIGGIYDEIANHNADADLADRVIIQPRTLRDRLRMEYQGAEARRGRAQARSRRAKIREAFSQ